MGEGEEGFLETIFAGLTSGHTHPTKFTEKRARRHAKNTETTQQNLPGKVTVFKRKRLPICKSVPLGKIYFFAKNCLFCNQTSRPHQFWSAKKRYTFGGTPIPKNPQKKNAVGGTPKMLQLSVKCKKRSPTFLILFFNDEISE